jgi:transcriptional regulator with XRE-family HTH domain
MSISLKAARVNANLSQQDVADKLGITTQTYLEYERGNRIFRVDNAVKFSDIVNFPFDDINFLKQTTV